MKRAALIGSPPMTLDRRRPLSPQIAAAVRTAIQTGRARLGDRLPSTRALAREIGVARQVVVVAYEELAASGHLAGRTGAGSYVAIAARPAITRPIRHLRDPDGQCIQIFPPA
jgi:GntR family transcriptional regulator/MocR family aminotransferase